MSKQRKLQLYDCCTFPFHTINLYFVIVGVIQSLIALSSVTRGQRRRTVEIDVAQLGRRRVRLEDLLVVEEDPPLLWVPNLNQKTDPVGYQYETKLPRWE